MKLISAIVVLSVMASSAFASVGQELCCAANAERAKNGKPALQWTPDLDTMATFHSKEQMENNKISHYGNEQSTYNLENRFNRFVHSFDYQTASENVGSGFDSVADVTKAWMESEGHRKNMLNAVSTVCGGGISTSGGFYTINFASPMNPADQDKFEDLVCSDGSAKTKHSAPEEEQQQDEQKQQQEEQKQPKQEDEVKPVVTKAPVPPKAPETPSAPEAPEAPSAPSAPEAPSAPSAPEAPSAPAAPEAPEAPAAPGNPAPGKCKCVPKGSTAAGKCKRVPKGSTAAGKCKPRTRRGGAKYRKRAAAPFVPSNL